MSQQINLFNPVFLKQRKVFTSVAMLQAFAVLLTGIAALAAYSQYSVTQLAQQSLQSETQLTRRQARLVETTAKMTPPVASPEILAQIAIKELQLQALKKAAKVIEQGAFGDTQGYAEYFRALARQHAPGLWLTGVSIGAAGQGISIEGRALTADLVPAFIGRLADEAALQGKSFNGLQITAPVHGAPASGDGKVTVPFVEFRLHAVQGTGG